MLPAYYRGQLAQIVQAAADGTITELRFRTKEVDFTYAAGDSPANLASTPSIAEQFSQIRPAIEAAIDAGTIEVLVAKAPTAGIDFTANRKKDTDTLGREVLVRRYRDELLNIARAVDEGVVVELDPQRLRAQLVHDVRQLMPRYQAWLAARLAAHDALIDDEDRNVYKQGLGLGIWER